MARGKRIALVTGANKGNRFRGCAPTRGQRLSCFSSAARDEKTGRAAVEKTSEARRNTFVKIDVASAESIVRAAEEFSQQNDRLDTLVNNAGIFSMKIRIS